MTLRLVSPVTSRGASMSGVTMGSSGCLISSMFRLETYNHVCQSQGSHVCKNSEVRTTKPGSGVTFSCSSLVFATE